jgi:protein-tyrosine phosphatase
MSDVIRVLFVCSGNICRSPTAHGVFETLVRREGLSHRVSVDSCGTGDWHVGEAPDERSQQHAKARGYELEHLRARQIRRSDLATFDLVLAMDASHRAAILNLSRDHADRVHLFLDFAPEQPVREVPDPYYGGDAGFERVLDLIESGAQGLLSHVRARLG